MRTVKSIVAVAILVVAGSAFGQAPAPEKKPPTPAPAAPPPAADKKPEAAKPPEMPSKAPAEMDAMKGMVGTWKCEGKMSGGGMDMPIKSTYKVAWEMDNMWLVGHVEGAKSKAMPRAYKGTDYYTYDPSTKDYVMLSLDNFGMWGRSTSKGWEGDKASWTGKAKMMGMEADTKTTVTRKGDKEVALEMSETGGGQTSTVSITCKK